MKILKLYYLVFILSLNINAQEYPPIIAYNANEYNAGNQNWMISQDANQFLYFANNDGLLEFNGTKWKLYNSPNETIIRSVKVIGNKVYTGCYMEFGYWKRNSNGKLFYTSISNKIKSKILNDEQFWNIINYENYVIFQSLNRIYIFDSKTNQFKIIQPNNNILKLFKTTNNIYFQTTDFKLYEIENGKSKQVILDNDLNNIKIVNIFSFENGLLIHTQFNGFFKLINCKLSKFSTEADKEIAKTSIYSSKILHDGSFAIGTISNGVFILTNQGKLKYHITQNSGLSNNTALSVFEDLDKNLWIGLDNGINCINLKSPIKTFSDNTGNLGTVYATIVFKNKLYVGTNQGLFVKDIFSNDSLQFIIGTKGQVWTLFEHENTLFCGHDSGTFLIENNQVNSVLSNSGTWKFAKIDKNTNLLLQGNYQGLSILEKKNGHWNFKNKIEGFNYSSKYFEFSKNNEIFVSHEYNGIFKINLNDNFSKVIKIKQFSNPEKGKNASLIKYNNQIYYSYKKGVFKLNSQNNQFEKDTNLSTVFENNEYTSGKLISDKSNKLWFFTKNYLIYFTKNKLNSNLKKNVIPIPYALTNSILGYENITQLTENIYLIGTIDGYYTININQLNFKNYSVSISDISINEQNKTSKNISLIQNGIFSNKQNNLTFNYTIPEYNKYINTEYQYILVGFQDQWSNWSTKSVATFENLKPGDYNFKVRARVANYTPENIATYNFSIKKKWFATNLAIILYLFLFTYLIFYVNKLYKNYYNKQKQKLIEENNLLIEIKELEIKQHLMNIKNEQLSIDVDAKNKELAVSTMSLIKKDELLTLIKDDLKKSTDENPTNSIKSIISTITKNISKEDNWNVFKEAFDNADKDFLKKVKTAHATLTPNDLRLCAYLRLNLSSKEIAPLLNISSRSIEIKRYRLRKKMNLTHEQGLVEYILSF